MDFGLGEEQRAIRDSVVAVARRFDDHYWPDRDEDGGFSRAFHQAMAEDGRLGITMPTAHGGAGLGVSEAALMMHQVASHGDGMAMRVSRLSETGQPCGAEANATTFLGARAGHNACLQAVLTHGDLDSARAYHVERLQRDVADTPIAPVTEQRIQSLIAEKVLGLPKSY